MQKAVGIKKLINRVPEATLIFWTVKVLSTTVGETAADLLSVTMNLGLHVTSIIMSGLLVAALLNQFRLQRYVPVSYWSVVVLVSIVGTLITDLLVDNLGMSLQFAAGMFSLALAAVFAIWYALERTLVYPHHLQL